MPILRLSAFNALKKSLSKTSIIALPNSEESSSYVSDASGFAISTPLLQATLMDKSHHRVWIATAK